MSILIPNRHHILKWAPFLLPVRIPRLYTTTQSTTQTTKQPVRKRKTARPRPSPTPENPLPSLTKSLHRRPPNPSHCFTLYQSLFSTPLRGKLNRETQLSLLSVLARLNDDPQIILTNMLTILKNWTSLNRSLTIHEYELLAKHLGNVTDPQPQHISTILDAIKAGSIIPSDKLYQSLLVAAIKWNDAPLCNSLWDDIQKRGRTLDADSYNTTIAFLLDNGYTERAFDLLDQMHRYKYALTQPTYGSLFRVLTDQADVEGIMTAYRQLRLQGLNPNISTYAAMAYAIAESAQGDVREALGYAKAIIKNNTRLPFKTSKALVRKLSKHGMMDDADLIISSTAIEEFEAFELLSAFAVGISRAEKPREVFKASRRVVEKYWKEYLTMNDCCDVIKKLCHEGEVVGAKMVLGFAKRLGIKPTVECYKPIVTVLVKENELKQLHALKNEFMRELSKPDAAQLLNLIISTIKPKGGKYNIAFDVAGKIRSSGYLLSRAAIENLVSAACLRKRYMDAMWVWDQAVITKTFPSNDIVTRFMMNFSIEKEKHDTVIEVYQHLTEHGPIKLSRRYMKGVVEAVIQTGRVEIILSDTGEYMPKQSMIRMLVEMILELKEFRLLGGVVEWIEAHPTALDTDGGRRIFGALWENDRKEEARKIARVLCDVFLEEEGNVKKGVDVLKGEFGEIVGVLGDGWVDEVIRSRKVQKGKRIN